MKAILKINYMDNKSEEQALSYPLKDYRSDFRHRVLEIKDGDFMTHEDGVVFIYKENAGDYAHYYAYAKLRTEELYFNDECYNRYYGNLSECDFSTPDEIERFNKLLEGEGEEWDAENKQFVKRRWRTEEGGEYFMIDFLSLKIFNVNEDNDFADNNNYSFGNYFQTKEEAEAKLKQIREVLKNE